jgi:hypothetical protein
MNVSRMWVAALIPGFLLSLGAIRAAGALMADSNHGVYGASKAIHVRVVMPDGVARMRPFKNRLRAID